jgi:glycosyltransferase involved in cell wall biosynthesis
MLKLSVIIAAYNERDTILAVLETVRSQSVDGVAIEIIVIDDGSNDGSPEIIGSKPELYDQFLPLPKNLGKGGAVKAGLKVATGDYVLFQDADQEYDPAEYEKLLLPVLKYDADVIIGSRMLAPQYTRVHYYWHKVGNKVITWVFNIVNNTTFTDIYSCYLMFRRSLVNPDELTTLGWEQHAEILTIASARGKVRYEVPIAYHGRTYEEGKKIRARHMIAVLWTIVTKGFRRWR